MFAAKLYVIFFNFLSIYSKPLNSLQKGFIDFCYIDTYYTASYSYKKTEDNACELGRVKGLNSEEW